jgi:DNA-binding NarL/FixJ family response regulator
VRLVLADDAALLRRGLARLLEDRGFEVEGQARDMPELMQLIDRTEPDVVVTDLKMPPGHSDEGFRVADQMRARKIGVLVLSQYSEPSYAQDLLMRGGDGVGYLLKDSIDDLDQLEEAIRRVAAGGCVVDPIIVRELVDGPRDGKLRTTLTGRELEILEQMAEGRSNEGIGEALFLSPKTVENYISRIFDKLGLRPGPAQHRRVLAVLRYLQS